MLSVAPVVLVMVAVVAEVDTICTGFARVVTSFATHQYEVDDVNPGEKVITAEFADNVDCPTMT